MQLHDPQPAREIAVGHGVDRGGFARAAFAVKQHVEKGQSAQKVFYVRRDQPLFLFVIFKVGKLHRGRVRHGAQIAALERKRRTAYKISVAELPVKAFKPVHRFAERGGKPFVRRARSVEFSAVLPFRFFRRAEDEFHVA